MRISIVSALGLSVLVAVVLMFGSSRPAGGAPADLSANRPYGVEISAVPPAIAAESYARLIKDPSASGVTAVVQAREAMRNRGAHETINFFNAMLVDCKDVTVHRAIRFELASLYRETGQQEKALEQLKTIMMNTDK